MQLKTSVEVVDFLRWAFAHLDDDELTEAKMKELEHSSRTGTEVLAEAICLLVAHIHNMAIDANCETARIDLHLTGQGSDSGWAPIHSYLGPLDKKF